MGFEFTPPEGGWESLDVIRVDRRTQILGERTLGPSVSDPRRHDSAGTRHCHVFVVVVALESLGLADHLLQADVHGDQGKVHVNKSCNENMMAVLLIVGILLLLSLIHI